MAISLASIGEDHAASFAALIAKQYADVKLPSLTRVEMFLTHNCTLRCDYCFVNGKARFNRMSWETGKKAVDLLVDGSDTGSDVDITFFGGEPLMEFALMKQIAEYARDRAGALGKKIGFSLTSNGTIMTEEIARFTRDCGFNIMFSIDGDRGVHDRHRVYPGGRRGSWDTVVGENFRLLRSIQGWMGARVTVCPDTVGQLSSGVRTLFDMGVNQFLIGPDMDTEWAEEEMEALSREMHKVVDFYLDTKGKGLPIRIAELEKSVDDLRTAYRYAWGCDAGVTRVAVSPDGHLYPCCKFVYPFPGMEGYGLGHVDTGFTEIGTRMEFVDNRVDRRPKCADCDISDTCGGGCPATNLHMRGSLFTPSDFDCFNKRLYRELLARIPKEMLVPDAREQDSRSPKV